MSLVPLAYDDVFPVLHQDLQGGKEVAVPDGHLVAASGRVGGAGKKHLAKLQPLGFGEGESQVFAVLENKSVTVRRLTFSLT